jgi:hypothetical protein
MKRRLLRAKRRARLVVKHESVHGNVSGGIYLCSQSANDRRGSHVFRVFSSQRCKRIEAILPKLQRALDRPVNNQVLNWYASCSCLSIKGKIQIARQTEERGS